MEQEQATGKFGTGFITTHLICEKIRIIGLICDYDGRIKKLDFILDTVSISLNNPDKDEYNKLVRSKFGDKTFDEMIDFAKKCVANGLNVVMTTVDTTISHEEEAQCRIICDKIGASYRIRPWES